MAGNNPLEGPVTVGLVIRSLIFDVWLWVWMGVLGIVFAPFAFFTGGAATLAMKTYARHVLYMLRTVCGLDYEIRGEIPTGDVIVAAKHQSFIDMIILFHELDRARMVMKRELIYTPVFGVYCLRAGMVPVTRGGGREAVERMIDEFEGAHGQIVIYPQGTRVARGASAPYKSGVLWLSEAFKRPVIPVALNTGSYWGRKTFLRRPGTMIVEFLPALPGGKGRAVLEQLEVAVEAGTRSLEAEAISSPNRA